MAKDSSRAEFSDETDAVRVHGFAAVRIRRLARAAVRGVEILNAPGLDLGVEFAMPGLEKGPV
jgi:hypothetical protein